jgi:hypothetical protein
MRLATSAGSMLIGTGSAEIETRERSVLELLMRIVFNKTNAAALLLHYFFSVVRVGPAQSPSLETPGPRLSIKLLPACHWN